MIRRANRIQNDSLPENAEDQLEITESTSQF